MDYDEQQHLTRLIQEAIRQTQEGMKIRQVIVRKRLYDSSGDDYIINQALPIISIRDGVVTVEDV